MHAPIALWSLLSLALLMLACSGSQNDKGYHGYMPRFSSQVIDYNPAHILLKGTEQTPEKETDSSPNPIQVSRIDCMDAMKRFNDAPQAAFFENSALEFIQNLQAQNNFYDCEIRRQVFDNRADIYYDGSDTTVISAFTHHQSRYYASWRLPTEYTDIITDEDLAINAEGLLINLQPDVDSSKTRVELVQTAQPQGVFKKSIKTTLQGRLAKPSTAIRSAHIEEVSDNQGKLLTQKIAGRIVFENRLSVISAYIQPGTGIVTFLKQCDEHTAITEDDYLRECLSEWVINGYDKNGQKINDQTSVNHLLSQFSLTTEGGSVLPEVHFYFGDVEDNFFASHALPISIESSD